MEERINILTTFIRSMLNERDAWKKYDYGLEAKSNEADANDEAEGGDEEEEDEVVLEEGDGDL